MHLRRPDCRQMVRGSSVPPPNPYVGALAPQCGGIWRRALGR